ncbi:MAG: hypothetical protein AB7K52_13165 [Phycisphaerales bacterium]
MSIIDWLVLAMIIATLIELVIELRRKRWWAAVMSSLVGALLVFMWWPMFVFLARKIFGGGP